jgi:hypothetical protein
MKTPNTRSPQTVNNSPKKPVRTYKTATGAQQYVAGNTAQERRDTLLSQTMGKGGKPEFRTLMAADAAEGARNSARIVGPKKAKTDSTVAMYNEHERSWADMAAKKRKK